MDRTDFKISHLLDAAHSYAQEVKLLSTCERTKPNGEKAAYACVLLTSDLHIVSYGYNGVAAGLPNGCLHPDVPGGCGCIHAEENALLNVRSWVRPKVAVITGAPCDRCAMRLVQAGIEYIIFEEPAHRAYPDADRILAHSGAMWGSIETVRPFLRRYFS